MPTLQSTVRYPRGKVTVNGTIVRFEKFTVIQNAYQQADSFNVQLPLFDPKSPFDWAWWAKNSNVEIEVAIFIGFAANSTDDPASWTQLIIGPVDAHREAPIAYGPHSNLATRARTEVGRGGMLPNEGGPAHPAGAVLTIEGRDYSGQLMDSEVTSQDVGGTVTSKDIVGAVAKKVPQLTLQMQGGTGGVGDTVNNIQGRLFLHRSAWDVIDAVADHEGMRARVVGKTLDISPPPATDQAMAFKIFYTPTKAASVQSAFQPATSNCVTLTVSRQLAVGKGIDRFVQGYDSTTGRKPSRAVAKARGSGSSKSPTTKTHNVPGLSQGQSHKHAKSRADQDSKFERFCEFQIPGDLSLTVDTPVQLSGTGTDFDISYEVDQLTHSFSVTEGYQMECRTKNRSSDVTITTTDNPPAQGASGNVSTDDPPAATAVDQANLP